MLKFGNLSKWKLLKNKEAIGFEAPGLKRVRVHSPADTNWFTSQGKSEDGSYLCTTTGQDELVFTAPKGLHLYADRHVRVYSSSGVKVHIEPTGNPSFAKISNREVSDPRFERALDRALTNQRRFMTSQFNRLLGEQDQKMQQLVEYVDGTTGEVISAPATGNSHENGVPEQEQNDPGSRSSVAGKKPSANGADKQGGQGGQLSDGNGPADE